MLILWVDNVAKGQIQWLENFLDVYTILDLYGYFFQSIPNRVKIRPEFLLKKDNTSMSICLYRIYAQ